MNPNMAEKDSQRPWAGNAMIWPQKRAPEKPKSRSVFGQAGKLGLSTRAIQEGAIAEPRNCGEMTPA